MQYGTDYSFFFLLTALLFLIASSIHTASIQQLQLHCKRSASSFGLQTAQWTKPKLLNCLLISLFFLPAYSSLSFLSWTCKLKTPNNSTVFSRCYFCNQHNDAVVPSHADTLLGSSLPVVRSLYGLQLSWCHLKLACYFRQVTSCLFLVSG